MMNFKSSLTALSDYFSRPVSDKAFFRHCVIIFVAAMLIRLLAAIPALGDPSAFLRPDSAGYWEPACAIAAGDGWVTAPGSDIPAVERPIGYPLYLAAGMLLAGDSLFFAALAGMFLSATAVFPVILAAKRAAGARPALLAGWLYALNITAIAVAPLILSDTLLAVMASWQLLLAVNFLQQHDLKQFAALTVLVVLMAMVKPVNLPVVLIGLPIILAVGSDSRKKFLNGAAVGGVVVMLLLIPYWVRNHKICGEFDGNTVNIYFHNGSAIIAHATGESSETIRLRLLQEAEKVFEQPEYQNNPAACGRWKKAQFAALIKKYPVSTIITHLPNIFNLLPDVPSLLENNRVTLGERGTMAVLRQSGFAAAVNHYLNGRWEVLLLLLPLLAVYALTLLLAAITLIRYFIRRQWRWLLLAGVLVFYYVWAPGPVISPRYLLPALPMLLVMAVQFFTWDLKKIINL